MGISIATPAAPVGFNKDAAEGHLLLFGGIEKKEGETQFGAATWAQVQWLADLDADTVITDVSVHGKALAPSIYEAAGAPPDLVVMAPRRARWLLANAGDRSAAVTPTTVLGMTLVESPSVPLTESSTQDRIIVARREDLYLGEDRTQVQVVTDAANKAANLYSRIRVSRYYANGAFKPAGVYIVNGAGLANPYT
jgi:hypothetical protein